MNISKHKDVLSDLEKDILSTINIYTANPFNRKEAERKISENNLRHPDIFIAISVQPGIENKPFDELTDMEIHQNLYLQIQAMRIKDTATQAIITNGY